MVIERTIDEYDNKRKENLNEEITDYKIKQDRKDNLWNVFMITFF